MNHTLWVIDSGVRDFRFKSIPGAMAVLNGLYLSNCAGDVGAAFKIGSAVATLAAGSSIMPGRFDAVVFLVRDVGESLAPKVGEAYRPIQRWLAGLR